MKRYFLPLFFACAALAGCGSVTSGIDFKAPAGWTTFSLLGRFQMWTKPSPDKNKAQMVFLVRGQTVNTMDFKQIPQAGTAIHNQKQSTIKICGNQRAQYISAVGTSSSGGGDEALEMISAPVGDQSFLSMYIRPQAMKADPAAEAAIRSLCAAKTTT